MKLKGQILVLFLCFLLPGTLLAQTLPFVLEWGNAPTSDVRNMCVNDSGYLHLSGILGCCGIGLYHPDLDQINPDTTVLFSATSGNNYYFATRYDTNGYLVDGFLLPLESNYSGGPRLSTIDNDGNVYFLGFVHDSIDVDPGPGVHKLYTLQNNKNTWFIAKYTPDGTLLYSNIMFLDYAVGGNPTANVDQMITDKQGNLYLSGKLYPYVDLDFDPLSTQWVGNSQAADTYEYLAKYDPSGNYIYGDTYKYPATGVSMDIIDDLVTDQFGNVYTAGKFIDSVDIDPGANVVNLTSIRHTGVNSAYSAAFVVAKFDTLGNYQFSFTFADSTVCAPGNIEIDVDSLQNIYLAGKYSGPIDLDAGPGTETFVSPQDGRAFLSKYNATGQYMYGKSFGFNQYRSGVLALNDMRSDNEGNMYIVGKMDGTADFSTDSVPRVYDPYDFPDGFFVMKYDSVGGLIDGIVIGGGSHFDELYYMDRYKDATYIFMDGQYNKADIDPSTGFVPLNYPGVAKYIPSDLTVSDTAINAACYGDTTAGVIFSPDNGTPPYTYCLNDTMCNTSGQFSNLASATYSYKVIDSLGKISRGAVQVGTGDTLLVNINTTNETCFEYEDAIIDFDVTGGVVAGPHTFKLEWFSGADSNTTGYFDSLAAGYHYVYTYTITNSLGCSVSGEIESTYFQAYNIAIQRTYIDNLTCYHDSSGAIKVEVTNTVPVSYLWDTGDTTDEITGLAAGTYTVTVVDTGGCVGSRSTFVTEPAEMTPHGNVTNIDCYQPVGSIRMYDNGPGQPFDYFWSDSSTGRIIDVTEGGTYYVTATSLLGCTHVDSFFVTDISDQQIDTVIVQEGPTPGYLSVADTFDLYYWLLDGMQVPFANSNEIEVLQTGNYQAVVYIGNCATVSQRYYYEYVPPVNGIEDKDKPEVSLLPNPTTGVIQIELKVAEPVMQVELFTVQGKKLIEQEFRNMAVAPLDITDLPEGIYLVKITTEQGSMVQRVVKQ